MNWIGVKLGLQWEQRKLLVSIPGKKLTELMEEIKGLIGKGMLSFKSLRSFTGRASWCAGVLPHARWAVNILYAVLTNYSEEVASGREEKRRAGRRDRRRKEHLVHETRVALPLEWLLRLFQSFSEGMERSIDLRRRQPTFSIILDASPWGLGGLLVHRQSRSLLEFFSSPIDARDEATLGITIGESSAQGAVEALAIVAAVRLWGKKLCGEGLPVEIRSDSSVALAMARKLASASPAINFLGAALALALEQHHVGGVQAVHVPGALNKTADWLSRLAMPGGPPGERPAVLAGAKERQAPERDQAFYGLPAPGPCARLWGGGASSAAALQAWPA